MLRRDCGKSLNNHRHLHCLLQPATPWYFGQRQSDLRALCALAESRHIALTCPFSLGIPSADSHDCHVHRLFAPDDCGMIEEDLDALAALFHADGEGLPREDVDRILNPLSELLIVLQLETPILISNFKQVVLASS